VRVPPLESSESVSIFHSKVCNSEEFSARQARSPDCGPQTSQVSIDHHRRNSGRLETDACHSCDSETSAGSVGKRGRLRAAGRGNRLAGGNWRAGELGACHGPARLFHPLDSGLGPIFGGPTPPLTYAPHPTRCVPAGRCGPSDDLPPGPGSVAGSAPREIGISRHHDEGIEPDSTRPGSMTRYRVRVEALSSGRGCDGPRAAGRLPGPQKTQTAQPGGGGGPWVRRGICAMSAQPGAMGLPRGYGRSCVQCSFFQ
jgi:hypothetical protein